MPNTNLPTKITNVEKDFERNENTNNSENKPQLARAKATPLVKYSPRASRENVPGYVQVQCYVNRDYFPTFPGKRLCSWRFNCSCYATKRQPSFRAHSNWWLSINYAPCYDKNQRHLLTDIPLYVLAALLLARTYFAGRRWKHALHLTSDTQSKICFVEIPCRGGAYSISGFKFAWISEQWVMIVTPDGGGRQVVDRVHVFESPPSFSAGRYKQGTRTTCARAELIYFT